MLEFEVLIDGPLADFNTDIEPHTNKNLLSVANDFEDSEWRTRFFFNFIFDNICETCLTKQERDALVDKQHSSLVRSVQHLRLIDSDSATEGSELAEILLYGVLKHHYEALPVVPKIFYKQNVNDNAKGADSVHIVVDGDQFTLWLGESKFYNSIENARLDSIVSSVHSSLASNKIRKENSIITNVSDLDDLGLDSTLVESVREALNDNRSIDKLKPLLHVPILLLHECPITSSASEMSDEYRADIVKSHKDRATAYFRKQVNKCKDIYGYEKITFHLILMPVPSKAKAIEYFLEQANALRG